MKFRPAILMTVGVLDHTKDPSKTIEMRIPQVNQEECIKSSEAFKFSPLVVDINADTRYESREDSEELKIYGVEI